jgi:galactokinase
MITAMNPDTHHLYEDACERFRQAFGRSPDVSTFAPGRIEVLGNHTDYNEGYVLSSAIPLGTFVLMARSDGPGCRVHSANLDDADSFEVTNGAAGTEHTWSNYVRGMLAGYRERGPIEQGFDALVSGSVPLGSGLSSSAALEMATGLALGELYNIQLPALDLARMGQRTEHEYAGARTGLLDQITSLHGKTDQLVVSDFRSFDVDYVPLGEDASFLVCNTGVVHANTDGEYNARRASCESAALYFSQVLDHEVLALRDVSWEEWETHQDGMDPTVAQHAAHPIGENARVTRGRKFLEQGDLESFGALMYASHASSITYFENSCPELDFVVETTRHIPGTLGARLSGGGFGGSALILVHPRDEETIAHAIEQAFAKKFGRPCEVIATPASSGASVLHQ